MVWPRDSGSSGRWYAWGRLTGGWLHAILYQARSFVTMASTCSPSFSRENSHTYLVWHMSSTWLGTLAFRMFCIRPDECVATLGRWVCWNATGWYEQELDIRHVAMTAPGARMKTGSGDPGLFLLYQWLLIKDSVTNLSPFKEMKEIMSHGHAKLSEKIPVPAGHTLLNIVD